MIQVPPININFSNAKFVDVFKFLVAAPSLSLSYTLVDEKTVLITKKS